MLGTRQLMGGAGRDRALVKAGRKGENPRVSPSLALYPSAPAGKHLTQRANHEGGSRTTSRSYPLPRLRTRQVGRTSGGAPRVCVPPVFGKVPGRWGRNRPSSRDSPKAEFRPAVHAIRPAHPDLREPIVAAQFGGQNYH